MKNSLFKRHKLLFRKEFIQCRTGKRFSGSSILISYKKNHLTRSRFGITVKKKFGNAVLRNRFKRLIREAMRSHFLHTLQSIDMEILPRIDLIRISPKQIIEDLQRFTESYGSTQSEAAASSTNIPRQGSYPRRRR